MSIRDAIEQRYLGQAGLVPAMREHLIAIADQYLADGHGDLNAEQRLRSSDNHIYWQQLSEVLLGHQLAEAGIAFIHQGAGPDFRIEHEGRTIWVEVITPTAAGVPAEWLADACEGVRDFPHEAMLLRWTAAIKQKAEVLLGGPDHPGRRNVSRVHFVDRLLPQWNPRAVDVRSVRAMNDYRRILQSKRPFRRFNPLVALRAHQTSRAYLERALGVEGPVVVVSHHAPSKMSVPDQYRGHRLSPAYASDLESLIRRHQPALWVHGHIHEAVDYTIASTRVISAPLGYPSERTDPAAAPTIVEI